MGIHNARTSETRPYRPKSQNPKMNYLLLIGVFLLKSQTMAVSAAGENSTSGNGTSTSGNGTSATTDASPIAVTTAAAVPVSIFARLIEAFDILKAKDEALTAEVEALKAKDRTLTAKVRALSSKDASLVSRVSALSSKDSLLASKVAALTSKTAALSSKDSSLASKISALTSKDSSLTAQISALSTKVSNLQYDAKLASDAVRLSHGTKGRVEVYHDGQWGTVCDDRFDVNDARVICRTMGKSGGAKYGIVSTSGQTTTGWNWTGDTSSTPVLLDELSCAGSEQHLFQCALNWGAEDCESSENVWMQCS